MKKIKTRFRKPIMIMGCTSDAGKSFLTAGICRLLSNHGITVAPFKAQNMSNNAAVTAQGLEIGRAQYLQALAARVVPHVTMNPILLKPTADTQSQVIVMGKPDNEISALPWTARRERLWPYVKKSLHALLKKYHQVVIEGAGSPAAVNLRKGDIVNMSVALECGAEVYIVSDIDRGGSFAHLLGTWECLAPQERALVKGFILNKFRGDKTLLAPAPAWLEKKTGVPVAAIIPFMAHCLPEEDAFHDRTTARPDTINIALVGYPFASNLDEFDALKNMPGVTLAPIRDCQLLAGFEAIILPGSKNTAASLAYLRASGLAAQICRAGQQGTMVMGICGGMQMLGQTISDPAGIEGRGEQGLGLLPIDTILEPEKITRQRTINWNGLKLNSYEIHHGRTTATDRVETFLEDGLGFQRDNVWGAYMHGLFDNASFRAFILSRLGWRAQTLKDWQTVVDANLNVVAQAIEDSGWDLLKRYVSAV
ncbi:MAG: cobyric acid synthase [Chitinivibrionales bacterium]|nr:cobyric acid synthase [Chitinivibrionales bacterium]